MEVIYQRCAGLDVHKRSVVACTRTLDATGNVQKEWRTFSTLTGDLLALADWLTTHEITHVAMESTGEYWKPVYNLLESTMSVLVVNPAHMKNVPGRKTDVKDAEWIADLLAHGLLRGSFIPPLPQRDLRDLTRLRTTLVQERAAVVNRLHKVLEWANLKLTMVVTDLMGVSARAMLVAIVGGEENGAALADLARGRLRAKRAELERALEGRVRDHHRFLIASHLSHIDFLEEQIGTFDAQIIALFERQAVPPPSDEATTAALTDPVADTNGLTWEEAVTIWDSIPGIARRTAEALVAEIGIDMARFPSAAHLASWAKLCPGNNQSAGKQGSGRTGKGNRQLRHTLIEAAHGAVRVKDSYIGAFYRRIVARRGKKRAIVAVAHKLLCIGYTLLCKRQLYEDLGESYFDERRKDRRLNYLRHEIEKLGFAVSLEPTPEAA